MLQQQPIGLPQPPVLPPQKPVVVPPQLPAPQPVQAAQLQPSQGVQLPVLKIAITPPPPQHTPKVQKRRPKAIPEEDEATGSRRPKIEDMDIPAIEVSPGDSSPQAQGQLGRRR